jgi:DNA-binding HxlR family transcriptional regulator
VRSYGQYCALAKALDVVGDRWTLLIVRELLLQGACRYTDLRAGLPGIATNLLADRLRDLERAGVIEREQAPPPIATTLFRLTPRGEELRPALDALARWGVGYMTDGPGPDDEFRSRWLVWPAELFLRDEEPERAPTIVELRTDEGSLLVEAGGGEVRTRASAAEPADAVIEGSPRAILGVLSGRLDLDAARALGLRISGDATAIARMQPRAIAA